MEDRIGGRGRPNLLFIMSDDHAVARDLRLRQRINETPNLDRIAAGGMRLDSVFCTNSICTPSRAAILTGTYNHVNGVTTLDTPMDNSLWTFPRPCAPPATRRHCSASGTSAMGRVTIPPASTSGRCCPARATTTTR